MSNESNSTLGGLDAVKAELEAAERQRGGRRAREAAVRSEQQNRVAALEADVAAEREIRSAAVEEALREGREAAVRVERMMGGRITAVERRLDGIEHRVAELDKAIGEETSARVGAVDTLRNQFHAAMERNRTSEDHFRRRTVHEIQEMRSYVEQTLTRQHPAVTPTRRTTTDVAVVNEMAVVDTEVKKGKPDGKKKEEVREVKDDSLFRRLDDSVSAVKGQLVLEVNEREVSVRSLRESLTRLETVISTIEKDRDAAIHGLHELIEELTNDAKNVASESVKRLGERVDNDIGRVATRIEKEERERSEMDKRHADQLADSLLPIAQAVRRMHLLDDDNDTDEL